MIALILFLAVVLPLAWFVSEFTTEQRWIRCVLGIVAIGMSFLVAVAVGSITALNYNAWYGSASKELTKTIAEELRAGNVDTVVDAMEVFNEKYHPNYENRANYDVLVEETVRQMKEK